ncbi:NUC091 domain-containing protein [Gorgonomyces haynaldii]|nr:NUC091 domain-containing protein [Gorgonomyces haynaldii]
MGKAKKEKNSQQKTASTTHSLSNVTKVKGVNFYRDAKKVRQLNVLKSGKPVRDKNGKIIKAADFQSRLAPGTQARVEPNRRWFENTRVVGQKELEHFREAITTTMNDPYSFVLRTKQLPLGLVNDEPKQLRMHLLEADPFSNTFGPKAQRKKPKLNAGSIADLVNASNDKLGNYSQEKDLDLPVENDGVLDAAQDPIFKKGQSKRIWAELYKVIDSSDVVIHVLDARDPMGTRCFNVERYLKKEHRHKHLIFVLNKVDLVPAWVTEKWKKTLEREYPTVAFHASITNPFGKSAVINLLRQFSKLHQDKKEISVGLVGYPNTGKSSIINALKAKKVCNVAPIPGETKIWQYITLMKRIYLIDCPGVVYGSSEDSETDIVLKGVVRVENITHPEEHVETMMQRVRKEYLDRTYGITEYEDHIDFLGQLAKKGGRLLKGGEPDISQVARMVLNDYIRGKLPFYTLPKKAEGEPEPAGVSVDQKMSKIRVTAQFLPEEMKNPDGETVEESEDEAEEEDEEEEEEVDFDDLVAAQESGTLPDAASEDDQSPAKKSPATKTASKTPTKESPAKKSAKESPAKESQDEEESEEESEEEKVQQKQKRMTTNKRKTGKNFYETANVKNKVRKAKSNDKKLMKVLKGSGKWIVE